MKNKVKRYGHSYIKKKHPNKLKVISITGVLAIGVGIASLKIYDKSIDHINEVCPLNKYFGVTHQVNVLESEGYEAKYYPEITQKFSMPAADIYVYDGNNVYYERHYKEGYTSNGKIGMAMNSSKTVVYPERIEISKDGVLIKKLELK